MECKIALDEHERNAILHQRHTIFVEEFQFFEPREDGQPIESDRYDTHAILLGVWENDLLIASCRYLLPNLELGLPTLNNFQIDPQNLQKEIPTAEISRITVAPMHRQFKKTTKILQSMQQTINSISISNNISLLIGAVEPNFLRLLNYASLPYRSIGPIQYVIGAERLPVLLNLQEYFSHKERQ